MSSKKHKPWRDNAISDGFILRYLEGIGTPRALAVYLLYKYGEHDQLVQLDHRFDVEPFLGLRSASDARLDYIATEFLIKADFLDISVDPKKVAIEKFISSEVSCRQANRRLNLVRTVGEIHLVSLLSEARCKIRRILGKFDPQEFIEKVGWGPGATVSLTRDMRLGYDKFRAERGMNANSFRFWTKELWELAFPRWAPDRQIETAYLHTVPKNSKTDRCIMIEPGISTMLQLGIGKMIRRRLSRVGINLRSQAELHQELVPKIARSGELATIDFSAASDSISRMLVEWLLPDDWFRVMDAHRSSTVRMPDGTIRVLEKFSSMGNGFTFELQTLIFYALATTVAKDGFISVFGDDVIIPSTCVDRYRELVEYCGLTVNVRKSFSSGYFRESCGAHSFLGNDAKPYYLRSRFRSVHDIFKAANGTKRVSKRCGSLYHCDSRFSRAWHFLVGASSGRKFRIRFKDFAIPDGFGDCGLVVDLDEAAPHVQRLGRGWEGFRCRTLSVAYRGTRTVEDFPLLLWRLFEMSRAQGSPSFWDESSIEQLAAKNSRNDGNVIPDLSSRIVIRRNGRMIVPCWRDLGPFE